MSAVVLPAAISHFTSTQVIFSNSTRSVFAHGAAHAGGAVSISEAVPPAINISKEFETEAIRMSLSAFRDNITSATRCCGHSKYRQAADEPARNVRARFVHV